MSSRVQAHCGPLPNEPTSQSWIGATSITAGRCGLSAVPTNSESRRQQFRWVEVVGWRCGAVSCRGSKRIPLPRPGESGASVRLPRGRECTPASCPGLCPFQDKRQRGVPSPIHGSHQVDLLLFQLNSIITVFPPKTTTAERA
jgi:hypothetical protein